MTRGDYRLITLALIGGISAIWILVFMPTRESPSSRELAVILSVPVLLALDFVWGIARDIDRAARGNRGLCPRCGYDLRAHAKGDRCPECGSVVNA